jgi:hypothetical protein
VIIGPPLPPFNRRPGRGRSAGYHDNAARIHDDFVDVIDSQVRMWFRIFALAAFLYFVYWCAVGHHGSAG